MIGLKKDVLALTITLCAVSAATSGPAWGEAPTRAAGLRLDGNRAVFTTDRLIVELEGGAIVRLFNRLTGTEYIFPPAGPVASEVATGLVFAEPGVAKANEQTGVVGPTVTKEGTKVLRPVLHGLESLPRRAQTRPSEQRVEYEFRSEGGETSLIVDYSIDTASGDLLIHQKGTRKNKGLAAIRFGLSSVRCNGDLLLPALGGIKASARGAQYQFESSSWQWPTGWMLPLLVFNDPVGGFWIHTQDLQHRFKSVKFAEQGKGTWGVAVETENTAPFRERDSIDSVTWRLNVFAGAWMVPVDQYKRWAYETHKIHDKEKVRPKWVDDIRLVIKHADYISEEQTLAYLDSLRQHVEPGKTLLFNTNWLDTSQGIILPRWVASERGRRFNVEARKRGFLNHVFCQLYRHHAQPPSLRGVQALRHQQCLDWRTRRMEPRRGMEGGNRHSALLRQSGPQAVARLPGGPIQGSPGKGSRRWAVHRSVVSNV